VADDGTGAQTLTREATTRETTRPPVASLADPLRWPALPLAGVAAPPLPVAALLVSRWRRPGLLLAVGRIRIGVEAHDQAYRVRLDGAGFGAPADGRVLGHEPAGSFTGACLGLNAGSTGEPSTAFQAAVDPLFTTAFGEVFTFEGNADDYDPCRGTLRMHAMTHFLTRTSLDAGDLHSRSHKPGNQDSSGTGPAHAGADGAG
jgi:hypothetical protein